MPNLHRTLRWLSGLLALTIVLFAALPASAQANSTLDEVRKRGTLKIGWAVWFPYAYLDPQTKKLTGFAVDLTEEMAKSLEVKPEWVEDQWGTIIAGLQANRYDVTIPMGITLKRAYAVTYTAPFIQFHEGLMVPKKDVAKYKTWRDLDQPGIRITTTLGATPDTFLSKALVNAELVRAKDGPTSMNQVLTGRAHAWANSYEAFKKVLSERDDLAVVPGPPMQGTPTGYVLRQGDYHFRDWINYFLAEHRNTGALLRQMQKHGMEKEMLVN
jgi:polar amino acid transport system substrate-binding protein